MAFIVNTAAYTERMRSSYKSTNGRTGYVQIYDRNWSGGYMGSFDVTNGGLKITFNSDGDDKYAPIVGSKCIVNMMVNNNNVLLSNFIDDIMGFSGTTYSEGDIMILIREGSIYGNIIFCGEYLQDLDTLPDVSSPYPIQLSFTDGIGKLKEIEFKSENVDTTMEEYHLQGHQKFSFWIGQILQHTKFYKNQANPNGFWNQASSTLGFRTCCRWWNADMYYAPNSGSKLADPLQQTKGTVKWTRKENPSTNQVNYASAYKVLKEICRAWGMRVICWMGQWHLYQLYEYNNVNTQTGSSLNIWLNPIDMDTYIYYADGDAFAQTQSMGQTKWGRFNNKFYNITDPGKKIQKLKGGKYKFLPVLNEVKVNLIHDGFQNVFPGFPFPDYVGGNALKFLNGPFYNSTQYKFNTNIILTLTPPNNSVANSVLAAGYHVGIILVRIIAIPPSGTGVSDGLATLSYNSADNTYSWDDTPTYSGTDLGPAIVHYSLGGPYPMGQTSNIPLSPNLEFPGYRDQGTDYLITTNMQLPATGPLYGPMLYTVNWTQINLITGYPFGSSLSGWSWSTPVNTNTPAVPSWSTGVFNNFESTIQPVSTNSATTNTVFVNSQTVDSSKLDWGKVYWGDGPEVWDDSALLVQTAASTYSYSNPNSPDWLRRDQNSSTPASGTGYVFNELLTLQIKQAQSKILRRANFKTANSPDGTSYFGRPFFVNPIGVIQDLTQNGSGGSENLRYLFRRGKFDFNTNQWDGEWIETTIGAVNAGSVAYKIAGGTNLQGKGNTPGSTVQQMQTQQSQLPKVILANAAENVTSGVAITSLDIVNMFTTDIQAATDLKIGTNYNLKSGDKVVMVYRNGRAYELTLTADVTSESTSISFSSITPDQDSNGFPSIQIPMFTLFENLNRKTSGKIAGFDVSATSLTKGGISIDGFLDSDTMTGASETTLPTSESVKAYVDASGGGGGLSNYSNLTTSTTSLTAATNGEGSGVPVAFDAELASSSNSITIYNAAGIEGLSDSAWCVNFGGDPATGYFELIWNITADTSVTNNRVLAGIKLQQGQVSDSDITWTDVNGTHAYIYCRGNGNVREGSASGSTILNLDHSGKLYFRILFWREAASDGTSKAITVTKGCQFSIKQINL